MESATDLNKVPILSDPARANLVIKLRSLTQDHEWYYIEACAKFAAKEFDTAKEFLDAPWDKKVEIAGSRNDAHILHKKYYKFSGKSRDNYLDRIRKNAAEHYHNSIMKLAIRLREKGMELGKVIVKSVDINANGIDIVLSDGNKEVRAWTIIAEGPIQRPHYRYLIK